jgi:hypothetical protein
MTIAGTIIRKHILLSALSLALLPLAAGAQSQAQSQSGSTSGAAGSSSTAGAAGQQEGDQKQTAGQQASGASASGAGTGSGTATGTATGKTTGKTTYTPATAFVVVPLVSPVQDEWMKTGCWAKLHDTQNFLGDTLTLAGPVDMPDMTGPFGIDWKGKISSIQTGAKATLVIYDNENYRDPVSTIKPGQRIPDVSKRMGFFDEMSSLRITCPGMTGK